jgi:hypothetical protein
MASSGWNGAARSRGVVIVTVIVTTSIAWASVATIVVLVTNVRIVPDATYTRLKGCPSNGDEIGYRMQARRLNPPSGGKPEKPTVTLEGAGIRTRQLLLH